MKRVVIGLLLAVAVAVGASAAPIPTPPAGNAVPLSQPTPVNPVQFVVSPGSIGSASALNSTFYKVYGDLSGVINALNGCSYVPGAAISTISAISPLNVTVAGCSAGTGNGTTATLSLTGVVPQANLPTNVQFQSLNANVITSYGSSGTNAWVPPVYNYNGGATGSTEHIVRGITGNIGISGNATINLIGSAIFSNAGSYTITVTCESFYMNPTVTRVNGSQFVIYNASTSTTGPCNFIAIGF